MSFYSRDAATVWICKNQKGRRNMTPEQDAYLLGKRYEAEKRLRGGTGSNQYTKEQLPQSGESAKVSGTSRRIAKEYGVSHGKVERAGDFSKAVDTLATDDPTIKPAILSGKTKLPKSTTNDKAPFMDNPCWALFLCLRL